MDKIYSVAKILKVKYKDYSHENKKNPLWELLFIICSIQTTENNYLTTFINLKRAFPRFWDLYYAQEEKIAKTIMLGGLSNQKAEIIKKIFYMLVVRFGRPTLSPLKILSDRSCEKFLTSLPGVGKKIARCVMMYSLDRMVFPVDTHCWRICQRLGWIRVTQKNKSCSPRDMDRLQSRIPTELRFSLHVNMVSLGREFCLAIKPKCSICPINNLCRQINVPKNKHRPTNKKC